MSDSNVSERRIRPIQDAVASGNWKQALQLCDKWSKKGEKSDRFLALKAFVLVNQQEKAQHDRGQQEVLDLCKRNPPITDHEAIYQMQDALKTLSLREEEGPRLWERAVTAKQNDKDLYMRWLNQAIADNNWRSAQKATMGLRKSFPTERNYEFWNILMCYLIHMQTDLPEKDRTLFGTLAYRMISKAAETTLKDQEQLMSPGKAISTPEEISLLAQVLHSTGHSEELRKLLQGETLSMESRTGKQDPQLVLSLLLESIEVAEQWDEALRLCENLLSKPEYQSDDRIWNLWLKVQSKTSDNGLLDASQKLLDSVCSIKPPVRAAYLAKLEILRKQSDKSNLDTILQTCKEYYKAYSLKGFCFDDLKTSLGRLDKPRLDDFAKLHSEDQGNLAQLFSLKLAYSLLPSDTSRGDILVFAHQALHLYQSSISEPPACPEAAFLAVLALLKLATIEKSTQITVFATIFLRLAVISYGDNYILTVLLIQLQSHLGLLSSAARTFTSLSVKNMQWETVGPLILTRISSSHPAASPLGDDGDTFEPLRALDTGLTVLENADIALVRGIREGLRFNSYSNIYNSVKMRSDIERSLNRQIYAIEERRLRRLLALTDDTVLDLLDSSTPLVDNRDFSYMPAYHEDDAKLFDHFRCGPLPKQRWIYAMTLLDNLATYLRAEIISQGLLASKALENLKPALALVTSTTSEELALELTQAEQSNLECHKLLAHAVQVLRQGSAPQTQLATVFEGLKSWLSTAVQERKTHQPGSTVAGIRVPTWQDIHYSLTQLETLQTLAHFLSIVRKKSKSGKSKASTTVSQETIGEIQTLVVSLESQIHAHTRDIKAQINESGVLGKLIDVGMARESELGLEQLESLMEKTANEIAVEMVCGDLKDSWDDALDGVLGVKVQIVK